MAYYKLDASGKPVETTLEELKAASDALYSSYKTKYPNGYEITKDNSQGVPDEAIPQLIGYVTYGTNQYPVYGGGSGLGKQDSYYGVYFNMDESGNLQQHEDTQYNEHWYEKLLKNVPRAGAIAVGGAIGNAPGAALVAGLTSAADSSVKDVPWDEALKRAALEAGATYAGGELVGAAGDYLGSSASGALSEEAFYLAESEGNAAYNAAITQGLGEAAAQSAYTEAFNSSINGTISGGSGIDNLSGDASNDNLSNTSEGTDVGSEPLTGSLDTTYDNYLQDLYNSGNEISEAAWNAMPQSVTKGISWLDAIKAGLILAPVVAGATASSGDTTASSSTTTNTLPAYTQPTAEKLFFDFIDDFYGTGTSGKSMQDRITEDTNYLNDLSTNYVSDSKNAVSGYQGLLSDILNQANTGTGYYTPVSFGFGGKKMASFVPKANRNTVDQILGVGQQQAGVNQGLVNLGYNEAKTRTPNEAANSYSDYLRNLMTQLIGGTTTATTTGTVDNSSQDLVNILKGTDTAAKLLEAFSKYF